MRRSLFAGWGIEGEELTREIIVPAPQVTRPTPRRPFDTLLPQGIQQSRYELVQHEEERDER